MANSIGQCYFKDGTVMYFEYYGRCEQAIRKLYNTKDEMLENWRAFPEDKCTCGNKSEEVEFACNQGFGFAWYGTACRSCNTIVDGWEMDDILDNEFMEDDQPDWWIGVKENDIFND